VVDAVDVLVVPEEPEEVVPELPDEDPLDDVAVVLPVVADVPLELEVLVEALATEAVELPPVTPIQAEAGEPTDAPLFALDS
jgi:hypothetical protein